MVSMNDDLSTVLQGIYYLGNAHAFSAPIPPPQTPTPPSQLRLEWSVNFCTVHLKTHHL